MAAYKDEERGTWYVSFHSYDWTGKNKRKLKRGFNTRKEALDLKTIQSEMSALFNHAVRIYELKESPVVKAGPLGKGKADEMNF